MKLLQSLTSMASLGLLASTTSATVITSPSVTGGSNAYGQATHNAGTYSSAEVFDGNIGEYASNNQGTNTFLQFQWTEAKTFDRVILVSRNAGANEDLFSKVKLTYDSGFDDITVTGEQLGQIRSGIYNVGPTTTQNVRFDVDAFLNGSTGSTGNTGLTEAIFLNTPTGTYADAFIVSGVTAYNSATPHVAVGYTADNAVDGIVGHAYGSDYSSNGLGVDTFVDFNMGAVTKIIGFDMIDRWVSGDQTLGFDLIFSNNSDFSDPVATLSYTKGTNTIAFSDDFEHIEAQYVRWDVTDGSGGGNKGLSEMIFYATNVPEPSAALLGGLGVLALLRRRRA